MLWELAPPQREVLSIGADQRDLSRIPEEAGTVAPYTTIWPGPALKSRIQRKTSREFLQLSPEEAGETKWCGLDCSAVQRLRACFEPVGVSSRRHQPSPAKRTHHSCTHNKVNAEILDKVS